MKPQDSYLYPYILAKRAKMSINQRSKSLKIGREVHWNYPYTAEVELKILVKAALYDQVTAPILEAAERGYQQYLNSIIKTDTRIDDAAGILGTITRIGLRAFPNSNFLNKAAQSISKASKTQWHKFVKQATGVDITIFETEAERETAANWAADNLDRLHKYAKSNAKKINDIIAKGAADNKPWQEVKNDILKLDKKITSSQARYMARDATGNLNSDIHRVLAKEAGIKAYKWHSRGDRKVRGNPWGLYPHTKYSHYRMNRVLRRWSDGKISRNGGKTWRRVRGREEPQHAGKAPNCRCTGEPVFIDLVKTADRELFNR